MTKNKTFVMGVVVFKHSVTVISPTSSDNFRLSAVSYVQILLSTVAGRGLTVNRTGEGRDEVSEKIRR